MRTPQRTFALVLFALAAQAAEPEEAMNVAETYLNALAGTGDESGKELLLGGLTMDAQMFTLENWKIISADPVRKEEGELGSALKHMRDLDKAGRESLASMMGEGGGDDDLQMQEVTADEAAKLMAPTRERAQAFVKAHPVLAYVARVNKELYWHPKNPIRPLVSKAGAAKGAAKGKYKVVVYRYKIETREGPRQTPRQWPLRVLRFQSKDLDTGWKIMPASDWAVE